MKRTATVSLLALALGLGSLPARAADTIVFGAAVSLTGKTAKEGEYTRDGYNFLVEKLNEMGGITVGGKKYRVEVKYYDDESKSERTAQLIEKLINEDKVTFILGPYGSAPSGTAAPICEKYRIPMIEANGSAEIDLQQGPQVHVRHPVPREALPQGHHRPRPHEGQEREDGRGPRRERAVLEGGRGRRGRLRHGRRA